MRVLTLGISGERFYLYNDSQRLWCGLKADALARMFKRAKYSPWAEPQSDALMFSSSMNWPQANGAPRRFDVKRINALVREAAVLLLPKREQTRIRSMLKSRKKRRKGS